MKQILLLLLCSTCILSCGITYKNISEDASGHIIDSEYTGKGKYICKIYNGRRPLSYMTSGDKYIGEWENGKFHGQGKIIYPWGRKRKKYIGEFKNGYRHGTGILKSKLGLKYVGEWQNDKYHGQGTLNLTWGGVYTGEFKSWQYHGKGKMTYPDGTIKEGLWENGEFIGEK